MGTISPAIGRKVGPTVRITLLLQERTGGHDAEMVSKERLEELRIIIREECGREVTDKELFEIGNGLINYFSLLAKIRARIESSEDA